jgi:hypothetical protein
LAVRFAGAAFAPPTRRSGNQLAEICRNPARLSAAKSARGRAREITLRAKSADPNGENRRASAPIEPTKPTATIVGQEKLSCISDNGRSRHRR